MTASEVTVTGSGCTRSFHIQDLSEEMMLPGQEVFVGLEQG